MNNPAQQAELYRKAAETIEMCAPHGIEPMVKMCGVIFNLEPKRLLNNIESCEFPLFVIEGQLVWADTVLYNRHGTDYTAYTILQFGLDINNFTLTPPKQPLCEVEGKSVYKGDVLYNYLGMKFIMDSNIPATKKAGGVFDLSWNPPKRTVMIELLVEDAEYYANEIDQSVKQIIERIDRRTAACRKALDNLK